jgi:hypothetical protein
MTPLTEAGPSFARRIRCDFVIMMAKRYQRCRAHSTASISATSEWRTMSPSPSRRPADKILRMHAQTAMIEGALASIGDGEPAGSSSRGDHVTGGLEAAGREMRAAVATGRNALHSSP